MIFVASFGDGGGKRTPYGAIFAASAFPHGTINVYPLGSVPLDFEISVLGLVNCVFEN